MNEETSQRQRLIRLCQQLGDKGLLAGADGNLSCRLGVSEYLVTPSGRVKSDLEPQDLLKIDIEGKTAAPGNVSTEWPMHRKIYELANSAKFVVHAHPPHAIAWTIAKPEWTELPNNCMTEVIIALGKIPIAPFAIPGSDQMGDVIAEYLPNSKAIILARHGAVSWGEDADESFRGMDRLENTAYILNLANSMGGLTFLSEKQTESLQKLRGKIGNISL